MHQYTIHPEHSGKRLDKWLLAEFPSLGYATVQKALRKHRVLVNGLSADGSYRLHGGDKVELQIDLPEASRPPHPFYSRIRPSFSILHEDENLLIVNKPAGLLCHPDKEEKVHTLLTEAQAYCYQQGLWDPYDPNAFKPALCNRIDRFTSGIVLIAKSPAALERLNAAVRNDEIEKRYLCVAEGRLQPPSGRLTHWLQPNTKRVTVLNHPAPNARIAVTDYKTLRVRENRSLLECVLRTGRTHQIRAQFAAVGHPLVGDTQYGSAKKNEALGLHRQALCAYKITFRFRSDAGVLHALNGRSFRVPEVPFSVFFPMVSPVPMRP